MQKLIGEKLQKALKVLDEQGIKYKVVDNNHSVKGDTKLVTAVQVKDKTVVLTTGDFIFEGTVGRMDLPGGSEKDMIESLNKMKKYDKNIKIYPGHGNSTYLYKEDLY